MTHKIVSKHKYMKEKVLNVSAPPKEATHLSNKVSNGIKIMMADLSGAHNKLNEQLKNQIVMIKDEELNKYVRRRELKKFMNSEYVISYVCLSFHSAGIGVELTKLNEKRPWEKTYINIYNVSVEDLLFVNETLNERYERVDIDQYNFNKTKTQVLSKIPTEKKKIAKNILGKNLNDVNDEDSLTEIVNLTKLF